MKSPASGLVLTKLIFPLSLYRTKDRRCVAVGILSLGLVRENLPGSAPNGIVPSTFRNRCGLKVQLAQVCVATT